MSDTGFVVERRTAADNFLIISNAMARGRLPIRLRAVARVLLLHLLSLPPGWHMTRAELDDAMLEGRDAVTRGLKDLETAGYLQRTRSRGAAGQWVWTWSVTDAPNPDQALINRERVSSARPELGKPDDPQVGPSTGNPSTGFQSIKEDGVEKTGREDGAPRARGAGRGTRLPADWMPTPEMIDWARRETPNVGWTETAAFRDYWAAIPGQRGTKLDWPATWRNWMRREQQQRDRHARVNPRAFSVTDTTGGTEDLLRQRRCQYCTPDGARWDRFHVPLSPAEKCDHENPDLAQFDTNWRRRECG